MNDVSTDDSLATFTISLPGEEPPSQFAEFNILSYSFLALYPCPAWSLRACELSISVVSTSNAFIIIGSGFHGRHSVIVWHREKGGLPHSNLKET